MKMKDKIINLRASEKEVKQINTLAKRAKMTRTDFIKHSVFNKEIVVLNGLKEFNKELKRIGENLNHLTKLSNIGNLKVVYLNDTKLELAKIHDTLAQLCMKKNEDIVPTAIDIGTDDTEIIVEIKAGTEQKLTEPIVPPAHSTSEIQLGQKRNHSIFGEMFGRKGDV